jgi:1-acyl-sn-glycerol-3-phosphate acyltransferase
MLGASTLARAGGLPMRWTHGLRRRESATLDYARLQWYRDPTRTYQTTARHMVPAVLRPLARLEVQGLANVPLTGPVILAPNHRDNLDPYLLLYLVPRTVHIAARPDAFGTGTLCAFWRRLGAFPADAWGMRYALTLLLDGSAVAVFPQARISRDLGHARGAVGLLALRSGAPVVPIAISGTEAVHPIRPFLKRAHLSVTFGAPMTFARSSRAPRSLEVADEILQSIRALLEEQAQLTQENGRGAVPIGVRTPDAAALPTTDVRLE